jgi:hypothetical protein
MRDEAKKAAAWSREGGGPEPTGDPSDGGEKHWDE